MEERENVLDKWQKRWESLLESNKMGMLFISDAFKILLMNMKIKQSWVNNDGSLIFLLNVRKTPTK